MPLVPVHDVCRLIDPVSFFGLSKPLIILPVSYFCLLPPPPHPPPPRHPPPVTIDDMVTFGNMICHCAFVKTCFISLFF